jgi:hypothetical protein
MFERYTLKQNDKLARRMPRVFAAIAVVTLTCIPTVIVVYGHHTAAAA